ncbi:alanine racemase [Conexibacter arvalis]|uniref:D-serine deaminase-like pyridoxal phosphate-dependent protein n=1 Tax=Conexibacter arvalis TaxID=912552 RepID=A0A840I9X9_9ACTN|nr:alanine racemase [Conexibacter arvalis]MBB4660878.1 D-serine deaminase-like pyridoxal phosphate-dependent protein [Conexibacter arvalis]
MTLGALDTPALVVDLDVVRANVAAMADLARERGVALRPHAKTHKLPQVARLQLDAGAVGLTVAKLGEAEVFADAGVEDLLIAYPLVGEPKLGRLVALARRVPRLAVAVDSAEVAEGISRALEAVGGGLSVGVRIEVDTGMRRLGLAPASEQLVALARTVAALPALRLEGVMTHEGQAYQSDGEAELARAAAEACDLMVASAEAIRAAGIDCPVVSMGSTATARFAAGHPGVTEIRPGTYVFNDRSQLAHGSARDGDLAAAVVATVVSRPSPEVACVDAGAKALTSDRMIVRDAAADYGAVAPGAAGWAAVGATARAAGWPVARASEEHGLIAVPPGGELAVGERLALVPNHICPAVNLFDAVTVVAGGRVVDRWPVAARGRMT